MPQWLGVHLPMQGTRVRALVREDPTCRGAAGPALWKPRAAASVTVGHNPRAGSPCSTTGGAAAVRGLCAVAGRGTQLAVAGQGPRAAAGT